MSEEKINELLKELFNKKIETKWFDGTPRKMKAVEEEAQVVVEQIIRQYLLENHDRKIGELEGKVYVYEKIIANSNFAPVLEKGAENEQNNQINK